MFWRSHDPRHPAYSTQYRSAVFYRTQEERRSAEESKSSIEAVIGRAHTAIEPLGRFYRAEDYHQKYEWKQFAQEWERETAGKAPDLRSQEFDGWLSKRGIWGCAAGKNAGKKRLAED